MFAIRSRVEIAIRVCLIGVISFNALVPTVALAESANVVEPNSVVETARTLS